MKQPVKRALSASSLTALLALGACSGDGETYADEGFEDTATTTQDIQNGTNDVNITGHGHTVQVRADLNCTGTLLRNDIVLTARHCFSEPAVLTKYRVDANWNGTQWLETVKVLSVDKFWKEDCSWCKPGWGNDDTDAVILRLAAPVTLDGSKVGQFRSLYPWEDANLDEKAVTCEGAGYSVCTGNTGSKLGSLLSMSTTVASVSASENSGRYNIRANAAGQRILVGDSGGSCWLWEDSASNYRQVFGVNKVAGCGVSTTSQLLNQTIRPFVRAKLGTYATDLFESFDSASALSQWTVYTPPTSSGGPPEWEISGGALREHSDMKGESPSVTGTGTHIIHNTQVMANAEVSTKIYSNDDDSAGIIFRYVNERNYYRLVANEGSGGTIQFDRVRDGVVTTYGKTTDLGFDWSDGVELSVISQRNDHWAYINGVEVTSMYDKAHPDGRTGLHNRLLKDASYVYFAVNHDDAVYPEPF